MTVSTLPAPTFQALIGELTTGKILTRVPLTGCAWQQVLNGAGTITGVTIDAADLNIQTLGLYYAAAPPKAFIAIQYDQAIIAAGPIWTHNYVRSTGILTLGGAGLWSLFDHRFILPPLTEPLTLGAAQAAVTAYATGDGMSLGDIAAAIVAQAQEHVGGDLPIVMPPPQGQSPGAVRSYFGYELNPIGARLTDLTGVASGPEIAFRPRIVADDPTSIEWVLNVGSPAQPLLVQAGADWVFDASTPASMIADITVDIDASGMATRMWELGSGSQAALMMSQADSTVLTADGYPLLESVQSHTTVTIQATLDAYASADLQASNRPATVWKLLVHNDGAPPPGSTIGGGPRLGQYNPGDTCQVVLGQDPYLPPGPRRARILMVSGDLTDSCLITLATMSAEV